MTKLGTAVTGDGDGSRSWAAASCAARSASSAFRSASRSSRSSARRSRRASARARRSAAWRCAAACRLAASRSWAAWRRGAGVGAGFGFETRLRLRRRLRRRGGLRRGLRSRSGLLGRLGLRGLAVGRGRLGVGAAQLGDRLQVPALLVGELGDGGAAPAEESASTTRAASAGNRRVLRVMAGRGGDAAEGLCPNRCGRFTCEGELRPLGHPSRRQEAGNSRQVPCTVAARRKPSQSRKRGRRR